jgi:hypothetical protein
MAGSCSSKAFRPSKDLFPSPGKDKKYYMKMEAVVRSIPPQSSLSFEASWNGSSNPTYIFVSKFRVNFSNIQINKV